jgi:putative two-component system response regulator
VTSTATLVELPLLVVDDELPIRRSSSRLLERAGYTVRTAGTTAEADAVLAEEAIGLVLCDVDLPGESGLALIDRITARYPDTAIVMITGIDDAEVAQVALDRGAYGYVIKPFGRNELMINVANALRRRQLQMENRAHRLHLESAVAARTEELRRSREELIQRLAWAADFKDPETATHLQRMSRYSRLLGRLAGLTPAECEELALAAPMHDIGKIGIPDDVLCKPGRYDADDRDIMQRHPLIGFQILDGSASPLVQLAAEVALTHHEWWDGTGYPNGLAGEAIPIAGRIVAIADVFDALMTRRRYKDAFTIEETVVAMLAERGRHFDPHLLDLFFGALPEVKAVHEAFADTGAALV